MFKLRCNRLKCVVRYIQKISVAEMRKLRWMCDKIKKDKVRNEDIRRQVGIAPIENKLRKNRYGGLVI